MQINPFAIEIQDAAAVISAGERALALALIDALPRRAWLLCTVSVSGLFCRGGLYG